MRLTIFARIMVEAMPKAKGTLVPDDFWPDELRLKWASEKHPNLDIAESVERFLAWATSYPYVNHSRAWQNFIIRASDDNKLGPMLKRSQPKADERSEWERLKSVQARIGADPPNGRTLEQYKAYLEAYARPPNVADLFKRVAK